MTREEFCRKLKQTRLDAKTRVLDILWALQIGESGLANLEKGKHSFSITRAINYLECNECVMKVHYNGSYRTITSETIARNFLKSCRTQEAVTVRHLAEVCSLSYPAISRVENGKSELKIDMFLKLCEALDIEIKIIKKKDKV